MKTGMKAPEGIGIVVETADIQNYSRKKQNKQKKWDQNRIKSRRVVSLKAVNTLQRHEGGADTFMMKKRRRMTKTLTFG